MSPREQRKVLKDPVLGLEFSLRAGQAVQSTHGLEEDAGLLFCTHIGRLPFTRNSSSKGMMLSLASVGTAHIRSTHLDANKHSYS